MHSGGFLDRFLRPSLKIGLLLMKNVLKSLVNSVVIPSVCSFLKDNSRIWCDYADNLECRNEWCHESS